MNDSDLAAMWSMEVTTTPKAKEPLEVPATKMNETELAVDSAAVRWAARFFYVPIAAGVLFFGCVSDMFQFGVAVTARLYAAFGYGPDKEGRVLVDSHWGKVHVTPRRRAENTFLLVIIWVSMASVCIWAAFRDGCFADVVNPLQGVNHHPQESRQEPLEKPPNERG